MVEPYSLKYIWSEKSRSEREYFYVYNKSGGSNPPWIRALLPHWFTSIENTEEKFTPRYQIELSKAGERPEDKYKKPRRLVSRVKRLLSSSRVSHSPKYTYQCSVCGKKFTKKTQGSRLGEHKNKSGYRCWGRSGIFLGRNFN
jgi:DNA-directed RNA polymerase subunit RPC12/RpoP